jgi:kynurenine formamidase
VTARSARTVIDSCGGVILFLTVGVAIVAASLQGGHAGPLVALLLAAAGMVVAGRLAGGWRRWLVPAAVVLVAGALALTSGVLDRGPLGGPFGYRNATGAFYVQATAAGLMVAAAACSAPPASAPRWPAGTLVDLSHDYGDETVYWPTAAPFKLEKVADGVTEQGYYYAANNFATSEHGGTHIDAPVHFAKGHASVDQIPLDRLVGPAIVVDVTAACASQPDYRVTTADFAAWERANGEIPSGSIVLIGTGYSKFWPDAARYLGTAERGEAAVAKLHFPGLHPDAATWLAESRRIKAIGLDTASIDYGQSAKYESHQILYGRDIPAFENLAALDRLPATGAYVVALPMKIKGGSGAPLRAIAIVPEK